MGWGRGGDNELKEILHKHHRIIDFEHFITMLSQVSRRLKCIKCLQPAFPKQRQRSRNTKTKTSITYNPHARTNSNSGGGGGGGRGEGELYATRGEQFVFVRRLPAPLCTVQYLNQHTTSLTACRSLNNRSRMTINSSRLAFLPPLITTTAIPVHGELLDH